MFWGFNNNTGSISWGICSGCSERIKAGLEGEKMRGGGGRPALEGMACECRGHGHGHVMGHDMRLSWACARARHGAWHASVMGMGMGTSWGMTCECHGHGQGHVMGHGMRVSWAWAWARHGA